MYKLLLADDNATIQRVIALTFASENVEVIVASDGEQAIARIAAERPDIVLADIGLSKRSGYDVASFVKERPELAHIPVMLLAGAFEPVDQARAADVGCRGVLVKPFEPQQVIARVRELVGGAAGSPLRATSDIPRPVERLTSLKLVEGPRRDSSTAVPTPPAPHAPAPPQLHPSSPSPVSPAPHPLPADRAGAGLDAYFDRLDAAFADLDAKDVRPKGHVQADDLDDLDGGFDDGLDVPTLERLLSKGNDSAQPSSTSASTSASSSTPSLAQSPGAARTPVDLSIYSLPPLDGPPLPRVAQPPIEPPDATATRTPGAPVPIDRAASGSSSGSSGSGGSGASASSFGHVAGRLEEPLAPRHAPMADVFNALLAAEQGQPAAAEALFRPATPVVTDEMVEELSRRILARVSPQTVREAIAEIVSGVAERLVREEIARIRSGESDR